jgi:hypothetical protein|tara:strand:+ start:812 stop:1348 length:537 start_codon:yes stop_codon:yes gene_type:complete
MRYIILLVASIFIFEVNAQNTKHELFGLDMNLDWYSLTNYSAITYFVADQDSSTTYVVTDFDYHLNQVDIELEKFNFSEYLIAFNKGSVANRSVLENLSPLMFLGRYKYPNNNSFNEKGFNDAEFLKNKLMKFYGEPELKIEKAEFRVYKWVVNDVTIIVNSIQNELMTVLTYLVNSR